ncbi:MAG: 50S ribosomal protein L17 [Flavobacteriales bacterium]|nr:50S ribosomal protein L17 [Flavobacteriales bacterium]
MRHNNKILKVGKNAAHRSAMLSNMACSLIEHKRISTTLPKARALRRYVEPILTKCKTDSTHSRRIVFSILQNKEVVAELFRDVAPKIADRPGGYTRIIKIGSRKGDGAEMAMIELVDFNEIYGKEEKKKTRRSRRGTGSTAETAAPKVTPKAKIEEAVEVVEEEAPKAPKAEAPAAEAEAPKAEAKSDDKSAEEKKDSQE